MPRRDAPPPPSSQHLQSIWLSHHILVRLKSCLLSARVHRLPWNLCVGPLTIWRKPLMIRPVIVPPGVHVSQLLLGAVGGWCIPLMEKARVMARASSW